MKYGIKAIFRFPVRSALFFLLITAAALFLSLGASIWVSAQNMLSTADALCLTAGEAVFQGGNYPNSSEYDPALADIRQKFSISSLSGLPGVILAEENNEHRAYVRGNKVFNDSTPYSGFAVIEVEVVSLVKNKDFYLANILNTVYCAGSSPIGSIYIFPQDEDETAYQPGRRYLMSGNLLSIANNHVMGLLPTSYAPVAAAAGGPDTEYPTVIDITEYSETDMASFWESKTGQTYKDLIKMVEVITHSVSLVASADVEAVESFHRREYTLAEGRFFTEQESGDSCIIPASMADKLGLRLGGLLELDVHNPVSGAGVYASYWPDTGFASGGSYEIVGIYHTSDKNTPVYIPDAGQEWLGHSENDYILGRVTLQNGMTEPFMESAEEMLPVGVTLRLFDQGYEHTVRSLSGMLETAGVIITVSAAVCLVILLFFGYIFISRHAASVSILMGLGAGARRVWLFFSSTVGLIVSFSAVFGGIFAYAVSGYLTGIIFDAAQMPDRRFSVSRGGFQAYVPEPSVELWPFFLSAALIIGAAVLICSVFILSALRGQSAHYRLKQKKRQIRRGQQAGKAAHVPSKAFGSGILAMLPGHSLRYGVKTMLRGGGRAYVTTVVFSVLFCSIGVMGGLRENYKLSLQQAYSEIPVTLHFTDSKGRMIDNLSITQSSVRALEDFDFVADIWYSRNVPYHFAGAASKEPDWVSVPSVGSFAYEAFMDQLKTRFPVLVMSDNPAYAKEFFYTGAPDIRWAEGFDPARYEQAFPLQPIETGSSVFHVPEGNPSVLVSEGFLQSEGCSLGDVIHLQFFYVNEERQVYDFRLAATIAGALSGAAEDSVYMSSGMIPSDMRYNAAGALLKNTAKLTEIGEQLSGKFSETHKFNGSRIWIYIEDTELNQTVENLTRHIDYLNALYPILLVVSVGLGFLIANLTLRSRSKEISLLRSVGTSKTGVFFSLFWEQLLLCVPGLLLGVLGILLILGGIEIGQLWMLGLYTFFFLLGAAAAIFQTQRRSLMKNLLEGE